MGEVRQVGRHDEHDRVDGDDPRVGWVSPWAGLCDRLDGIAEQLVRCAADIAAAEYRWLVLLEEFDRDGGWAQQGAKTCVTTYPDTRPRPPTASAEASPAPRRQPHTGCSQVG